MEKENQITSTIVAQNPLQHLSLEQLSDTNLVTFGCFVVRKNNLQRTMKYFNTAEKIHAGADANQKINFHRPKGSVTRKIIFRNGVMRYELREKLPCV